MPAATKSTLRKQAEEAIYRAASLLMDASCDLEHAEDAVASSQAYHLHNEACALRYRLTVKRQKKARK